MVVEMDMEHAGLNRRLFSGIIDGVLLLVAFGLLGIVITRISPFSEEIEVPVLLVLCFLYTPLMCRSSLKGTIGMVICRTRLVNDDMSDCSWATLLVHTVLGIVIHIPLVCAGVIPFFIYSYIAESRFADGKLLPDYITKTQCIRR